MHLISNMVSTIKVGYNTKHLQVFVQNSKLCIGILDILYKLGYIRGFVIKDKKNILVLLKYTDNKSAIRNISVVSTPGRRMFIGLKKLKFRLKKKDSGFFIVSTNKGLLTDDESLMFNTGGELLIKVN
jgi:small subunit ribosomal protein S8